MRVPTFCLTSLLALTLAGCAGPSGRPRDVVTGAVAHFLCSQTFVSGEDPAQVYADTFWPIPGYGLIDWGVTYAVDRQARTVRADFVGTAENVAVYRDGLGCTLTPDGTLAAVPSGVGPTSPPDPPITAANSAVRAAIDAVFAEPAADGVRRNTKAVVVMRDGKIIGERYAPGIGPATPLEGNSMTKSATSALVGLLVQDGRLNVDAPAPLAAWAGARDGRQLITLDHLMRMQSGLSLGDALSANLASLWSFTNRMMFAEADMAAFAAAAPVAEPPGSSWTYSDSSYVLVGRVVRETVGGRPQDVRQFAQERLFGPLGMTSATLEYDAAGNPIGAAFMLATARDWAKLGQLFLDDGMVGTRRLLPAGWAAAAARPTPGAFVGYGAGFWINSDDSYGARFRRAAGMPAESYFGKGQFGQYLIIVPSARLVIVRLGTTHGHQDVEGMAQLTATLAAMPAK